MTSSQRTDIHRPSAPEFDPEGYFCAGVFDTHPEEGDNRDRAQVIKYHRSQGRRFNGPHGSGHQCGHCGAHLRYVALMIHEATGTMIYAGEDCLDNRFDGTADQFRALRRAAAAKSAETREARRRHETEHAAMEWLVGHSTAALDLLSEMTYRGPVTEPGFGSLAQADDYAGSVLSDMGRKLSKYGSLSPRQAEFAMKLVSQHVVRENRAAQRAAEEAARKVSAAPAPTGRVAVSGRVVSTWERTTDYGIAWKMRVETTEGWVAMATIPAAIARELDSHQELRGAVVSFTATFTPTEDDPTVAFANRPSKARIERA